MSCNSFLKTVLSENTPVFLAASDADETNLTLHIPATSSARGLNQRIDDAVAQADNKLRVTIRRHDMRRLAFPRSLEHWLREVDLTNVIYDPTLVATRAQALVAVSKECRRAFGGAVEGLYFDQGSRRLLVVTKSANVQATIGEIIARTCPAALEGGIGVQVVADAPISGAVPVDAKSASVVSRMRRAFRRWRTRGVVALTMSAAAALPAAAHTSGPVTDQRSLPRSSAPASSEYGLLSALSVFTDGQASQDQTFAASGMQVYFGRIQLAQDDRRRRRPRDPEELGQVGGGGGAGPGS